MKRRLRLPPSLADPSAPVANLVIVDAPLIEENLGRLIPTGCERGITGSPGGTRRGSGHAGSTRLDAPGELVD